MCPLFELLKHSIDIFTKFGIDFCHYMINELCNSDFLMIDNKSKANARKNL